MKTIVLGVIFSISGLIACNNQTENKKNNVQPGTTAATIDSVALHADKVIRNVLDSTDTTHYVYLTFDDGPYQYTPPLSKLLNDKKIKSSFFVIGSQIMHSKRYDSIYNSVKNNPLFRVYNHTVTHAITYGRYKKYYKSPDTVINDFTNNKRFLPEGNHITRLPGTNAFRIGSFKYPTNDASRRVLARLDSIGSKEALLGWNANWTDKESRDSAAVVKIIQDVVNDVKSKRKYHQHTVILFHDFYFKDAKSLQHLSWFIDELQNKYHCVFRWAEEFPDINS